MRTINQALAAAEKLDIMKIFSISMYQTKENMMSLNKSQLYDGKTSDGIDLSPLYTEDPYFKTPESAKRYSEWKDRITPNSKRKKDVPNLYINGAFYDSWKASSVRDGIEIESSFMDASKIEYKFGNKIYGLGGEYRSHYINYFLRPILNTYLIKTLNSK